MSWDRELARVRIVQLTHDDDVMESLSEPDREFVISMVGFAWTSWATWDIDELERIWMTTKGAERC